MKNAITAQEFRRMENFILSLLNPEELGLAVPAHVRDSAREALGRRRVETQERTCPSPVFGIVHDHVVVFD